MKVPLTLSILLVFLGNLVSSSLKSPEAPQFESYIVSSNWIYLKWSHSSMSQTKVEYFILQQKHQFKLNNQWVNLTLKDGQSFYHHNVTNLKVSTKYSFRVLVHTQASESQWSPVITLQTLNENGTKPSVMTEVNFVPSYYSINISWKPPNSSSPIEYYQLQRTDFWNDTGFNNVTLPNNGLTLSTTVYNLLAGIPYDFRIRAFNVYGGGNWSFIYTISTLSYGNCGDYYNTIILRSNCDTILGEMANIYISCEDSKNSDECQSNKIEVNYQFTSDCTQCYVQFNDCVGNNCFPQCMSGNGDECKDCVEQYCSPDMVECSGYPNWPMYCVK